MKKYILKRTLMLIPTFIGVIAVLFFIFMAVPGNYIDSLFESSVAKDPNALKALAHKYYLDRPRYEQFFIWLSNALKGNLGVMYTANYRATPMPITSMVMSSAKATLKMLLSSIVTSFLIAIPLGVISAVKRNEKTSKVIEVITTIGISMPPFLIALFFFRILRFNKYVFQYQLVHGGMSVNIYHAFLVTKLIPFLTIIIIYVPKLVKYLRNNVMNVLGQDYIKTARSQGFKEKTVLYKYALKNALIPVISYVGSSFTSLFSDLILIEASIKGGGFGTLFYSSISNRQYNITMAATLVLVIMILLFNYVIDLCYAFIDPRIRFD